MHALGPLAKSSGTMRASTFVEDSSRSKNNGNLFLHKRNIINHIRTRCLIKGFYQLFAGISQLLAQGR